MVNHSRDSGVYLKSTSIPVEPVANKTWHRKTESSDLTLNLAMWQNLVPEIHLSPQRPRRRKYLQQLFVIREEFRFISKTRGVALQHICTLITSNPRVSCSGRGSGTYLSNYIQLSVFS